MLIEFTGVRQVTCDDKREDVVDAPVYVLLNEITDVSEAAIQRGEGLVVGSVIGLRSGRSFPVYDSTRDVLDALKFVTRHIGVTPGIADKIDGVSEAIYPWRRCEKVSELAKKWRAHEQTMARSQTANPPLPTDVTELTFDTVPGRVGATAMPFGMIPASHPAAPSAADKCAEVLPPLTREGVGPTPLPKTCAGGASIHVPPAQTGQALDAVDNFSASTPTPDKPKE